MSREFIGQQNSPQIGVADKLDAEHVEHLALQPVGPFPQVDDRIHLQVGLVQHDPDRKLLSALGIREQVSQAETIAGIAVGQVVDTGHIDQQVEPASLFQVREKVVSFAGGNHNSRASAKFTRRGGGKLLGKLGSYLGANIHDGKRILSSLSA